MEPYLTEKAKVKKLVFHTPQHPVGQFVKQTVGRALRDGYIPLIALVDAIFTTIKDICDALLGDEGRYKETGLPCERGGDDRRLF